MNLRSILTATGHEQLATAADVFARKMVFDATQAGIIDITTDDDQAVYTEAFFKALEVLGAQTDLAGMVAEAAAGALARLS